MCEFIETYQTLIVGFVGFGGVIIAMLGNARLQRKQDERRERREARALRTALIEEAAEGGLAGNGSQFSRPRSFDRKTRAG
jgi:hypothetical protein